MRGTVVPGRRDVGIGTVPLVGPPWPRHQEENVSTAAPVQLDPVQDLPDEDRTAPLRRHLAVALGALAPLLFTLGNVLFPDLPHSTTGKSE